MSFSRRLIWSQPKSLGTYAESRDNNFNLIRMVAAIMVIFGHSFFLVSEEYGRREPLQGLIGIDSGSLAVNLFFVISGFLVVRSYLRSRLVATFLWARFLRIFPGLFVAVLFNVFVVGVIFTELPLRTYLSAPGIRSYLIVNSTLVSRLVQLEYGLPGVFENNPAISAVNGSLWTLPYEVWIYFVLVLSGVIGIFRSPKITNSLFVILIGANTVIALGVLDFPYTMVINFLRFSVFFGCGVIFYINRHHILLDSAILLCLLALTATVWHIPFILSLVFPLSIAYIVIWLAYIPGGPCRFYNRLGDYSYGLYIYAYPIQQSILVLMPDVQPLVLFGVSVPVTVGFAVLSWHLVERQALRFKYRRFPSIPLTSSDSPQSTVNRSMTK